jgi:hypothetical protein
LPRWRAFILRLQGRPVDEFFNERFSDRMTAAAHVLV